eukprot:5020087-Lingulodinium_polyedra.AAC.1
MRTPVFGVRAARATRAIRKPPRQQTLDSTAVFCVAFEQRYTQMRSNTTFAATVARKSQRTRTPCEQLFAWNARVLTNRRGG